MPFVDFYACTEDMFRALRAVQALISAKLRVQVPVIATNVRVVRQILRCSLYTGSLVDARSTLGSTIDKRRCLHLYN